MHRHKKRGKHFVRAWNVPGIWYVLPSSTTTNLTRCLLEPIAQILYANAIKACESIASSEVLTRRVSAVILRPL
jgi:hypothetical protein